MRNPLPALALLALAAAVRAQTFVLSPVATSGYIWSFGSGTSAYELRTELRTFAYRNGTRAYVRGWRAEFRLPTAPAGTRLASAFLEARVVGTGSNSAHQFFELAAYNGTGTILPAGNVPSYLVNRRSVLPMSTLRVDVAAWVGSGPYVGLDLAAEAINNNGSSPDFSWSASTLSVTYAPVPEPSALAVLALGALPLVRRRRGA